MKKFILLIAIFAFSSGAKSQVAKPKAVFPLNFIRYVGWNEEAKKGDFVIGVVRDKETADYLRNSYRGRKFGFQNVVVKEFRSPADVTFCQVLFIPDHVNLSKNLATIIDKLGGKNTLIITEKEIATKYGSIINFVIRDEKLKHEVNKANTTKLGLKICSRFESMTSAIKL